MKVVIIGGHLSPALAVIEKLKNDEVFFVGRKNTFEGDNSVSFEYQEITKLNIPFFSLASSRLQRKFTRHTFSSLSKFPIGLSQSIRILRKIEPDVVLGFGGYVSLPVVLAANLLKIPLVIHEQTLEAGFTNKLASKFAKKICISWESSAAYFPKEKTILTGNPLKNDILNSKKNIKVPNKIPVIYITGGSTGAHAINIFVENNLEKLLKDFVIVHQTGDAKGYNDYDRLEEKKQTLKSSLSSNCTIKKFISAKEVAQFINSSDLVVGRSGINTVTELIFLEKPAFLIPLPIGQKNEQLKNAQFFKNLGLGEFADQNLLTNEEFFLSIRSMIKHLQKYKLKEKILITNAAEKIVEVLRDVSKKKAA